MYSTYHLKYFATSDTNCSTEEKKIFISCQKFGQKLFTLLTPTGTTYGIKGEGGMRPRQVIFFKAEK